MASLITQCTHWIGSERRYCHNRDSVRAYLTGPRCPVHTPSALRGVPEPQPGPGLPAGAQRRRAGGHLNAQMKGKS